MKSFLEYHMRIVVQNSRGEQIDESWRDECCGDDFDQFTKFELVFYLLIVQ